MKQAGDVDMMWSEQYDQGREFTLITSWEISHFLTFMQPGVPRVALDIGCGIGHLTRELYHRGYRVVGADASSRAVDIAKSLTVVPNDKLQYMHFDIERDDIRKLSGAPYGLIVCKLVYAFIQDKPAFLSRVKELLVPGGIFVVVTRLIEDVPPEKAVSAVDADDVALLVASFRELARYRENSLTYFVVSTSGATNS